MLNSSSSLYLFKSINYILSFKIHFIIISKFINLMDYNKMNELKFSAFTEVKIFPIQ